MSNKLKAKVYDKKTGEQMFLDGLAENTFMKDGESVEVKVNQLEKKEFLGCVLRPINDSNNPVTLFEDSAHEKAGINNLVYDSTNGTITLNFDKTYSKIHSFNVYADEMMKIYGLDVGASVGLSSAKLFLVSNLSAPLILTFTTDNGITYTSNFIDSANWVSNTGVVIKLKNIPMQSPKSIQVTVTNALNLRATASITGNREITIKFYKNDGSLVTDIAENWSCMVDCNFRGLCNFNVLSVYDSDILSSSAFMFNAMMKN